MYLTADQRRRIDQVAEAQGVTLAEVVRRAVDAYLAETHADVEAALAATFGVDRHATAPDRDEWDRG